MKIGIASFYLTGEQRTGDERIKSSRKVLERITEHLGKEEAEYFVMEGMNSNGHRTLSLSEFEDTVDLIVSIGGDGTIIEILRGMNEPIPILGVNTGRIGFMADTEPNEAVKNLDKCLDGFDVYPRARNAVHIDDEYIGASLNECVVTAPRPSKLLEIRVSHGGDEVESLRSDGVIISTPTGSTAYSLSAGGPLVEPTVDSRLVIPLAPFTVRRGFTWVLDGSKETVVEPISDEDDLGLVLDGERTRGLSEGDEVRINRHAKDALFVDVDGASVFEYARNKLG